MQTPDQKHCPICNNDLPISEFGICRARRDGRNLYCKGCVREKVYNGRQELKLYKAAQKKRIVRQAEIAEKVNYDPLVDSQWPIGNLFKLSPVDRVRIAIKRGCRTQAEIRIETKLSKDQIGDALANLLLWTKEIRTELVGETRMYFMNKQEVARKANVREMMKERRVERVA